MKIKKSMLFLLLLISSAIADATTYYVSNSGLDSNNGTSIATPFKTIDKVNALILFGDDLVLFKRGDVFNGTLNITKSGSSGSYITYGAYGTGNNPIISGFTSVTAWTNLGNNIWESTNTVSNLSTCNMVAINDVNTAMGRTPNAGTYYYFQSHTTTSLTSSNLNENTNWAGAEAVIRSLRYKWDRRIITSQSTSTINWSSSIASLYDGRGFFIQNDAKTLDTQNEWYYNQSTKKLRIYSTSQPSGLQISTIDNICVISSNYIVVENIDFKGANQNAIYSSASNLVRIKIDNCNFSYTGKTAIRLRANYLTIQNCNINESNDMAIHTFGSNHCVITENTIDNVALYPGMIPSDSNGWAAIMTGNSDNLLIEYNNISDVGYNGISFGGSNNSIDSTIIARNYINGFCSVMDDGGGIYGGQNAKVQSNIVVNGIGANSGTDVMSSGGQAVGIYFDRNSSNCQVSQNTVLSCSFIGILMNNPQDITITQNTVFNIDLYAIRINDFSGYQEVTGNVITYNKFISKISTSRTAFFDSYQDGAIVNFGIFNNNYYARPIDDTNVIYVSQVTGSGSKTLSQWKTFSGQDANSLGSPKTVSSVNDIYFYYNDTKVAKVIQIEQPSIDMASTAYYTPITLQPFSSVVLIRDATLGNYYYLSTSGNDSNSGILMSSPWKTLAKANATNFADGDKIYMKAGDVWSGEMLTFTNAIQGWDDEILVTSYGTGNKPTISGFETLTSWTSDGNGIYHATVSNSACNMVTVNGVNTPIARYPKTGYLTFESFSVSSSITDNELAASPSWNGAKAVIRVNGFQYAIASVTGHSSHTLSLSGSSTPDATGEYKYFLQGHTNALTSVGDWYLSGTTLYMYFGANNPSSYTVKAAKVAKLVTTDKNYVTLDGIRIEGAIEKGYESTGTHNTVQNCEFEFMGRYGITCAQTTPTIDNNKLNNGNGTAIFMNANSYVLKNNTITNNGIYAGMVEPTTNNYFGINIVAGSGGTCEYNTISNVGYIGISTWGSNNIIRYNKINGFCSILPDGGGIYANYIGTSYPTGIKVYNNIVLNGGGEGLYSDAVNQNTEWYNNTVMNCVSGILLNTPINHNVHDNTFYNCTYGMNFYNWHTNSLTPAGCTVSNNTIVEGSSSTFAVKIGDSTNRDILSMGTVTGNKFYSETGKQTAQFKAYFNPSAPLTNYNLADWRALTGFESTSTLSTIANFNKLSTIYNDTKANKDFTVVSKKDLSGVYINGTVTLAPFISKVLVDGAVKYVIMNKKMYAL